MSMHNLGIPDLPIRAFMRHGRNILPQGKGSAPKTPDYKGAAEATAAGNLEAAKYATQANRANQYTPWGNLIWTSDRQFNQEAYDRDLASYNQARADYESQPSYTWHNGMYSYGPDYGAGMMSTNRGPAPVAPNAADYYTGGDNWSQTITLSPEMQALYDQEMRLQQGMFGAQNAGLDRVNQMMSQGFDMSGVPQGGVAMDTNALPSMGQALNTNSLPGFGQTLNINSLPGMGTALDTNSLTPMGEVFVGDRGNLATYDSTLATNNATELLMQRINPQLDQQQNALRARLAQQGIVEGSEAYNRAMTQHQQGRNDAYTQAALQGIGLGMQQQGMMFDQGMQNRQLTAAEQAQRYAQMTNNRQMGVNEQAQQFAQQQGLRMGEAGLQDQRFSQQTTNQQLAAALQAQQFAQQQGLRLGEAGLQNQQFAQAEQARNRAIQEQAYLRNLPLNELNALRTGNQVGMPQFPGYAQQATTAGPDILGATNAGYQAQLGAYNAQQAGNASMLGGLFGLAGNALTGGLFGGAAAGAGLTGIGTVPAALMAGIPSDRRLKRNIQRIGKADNGLSIYSYTYIWGGPTQLGYMADEVEKVAPHAVGEIDGFKTVNYGAI